MIISFGSKETRKIYEGSTVKNLPVDIQNIARRKLKMIHNSQDIKDLRLPPSNRLEKLKGKASDYYSIRINLQWRIIFIWENDNAFEVQIVDYH